MNELLRMTLFQSMKVRCTKNRLDRAFSIYRIDYDMIIALRAKFYRERGDTADTYFLS